MEERVVAKVASLLAGVMVLSLPLLRLLGICWPSVAGIYDGAPLSSRLLHPLVHVSLWHAAVNVYVLWQLAFFFPLRCRHFLFAYCVACSCPSSVALWGGCLSAPSGLSAVGLSGVEYVLMGWVMPGVPCRWRFNVQLAAWSAASLLSGGVAVGLHLYCYCCGVAASMLFRRR